MEQFQIRDMQSNSEKLRGIQLRVQRSSRGEDRGNVGIVMCLQIYDETFGGILQI